MSLSPGAGQRSGPFQQLRTLSPRAAPDATVRPRRPRSARGCRRLRLVAMSPGPQQPRPLDPRHPPAPEPPGGCLCGSGIPAKSGAR